MLNAENYSPKHLDKRSTEKGGHWTRLQFTLFSLLVSSSFFASYSVGTFYTVFLYALAPRIRVIAIFGTWKGFVFELTDGRTMFKLFEACYIYRYEQDLYHEEETYRMI